MEENKKYNFQIEKNYAWRLPLREEDVGVDQNLGLVALDGDRAAQVVGLSVDLNALLKEGFLNQTKEKGARRGIANFSNVNVGGAKQYAHSGTRDPRSTALSTLSLVELIWGIHSTFLRCII